MVCRAIRSEPIPGFPPFWDGSWPDDARCSSTLFNRQSCMGDRSSTPFLLSARFMTTRNSLPFFSPLLSVFFPSFVILFPGIAVDRFSETCPRENCQEVRHLRFPRSNAHGQLFLPVAFTSRRNHVLYRFSFAGPRAPCVRLSRISRQRSPHLLPPACSSTPALASCVLVPLLHV